MISTHQESRSGGLRSKTGRSARAPRAAPDRGDGLNADPTGNSTIPTQQRQISHSISVRWVHDRLQPSFVPTRLRGGAPRRGSSTRGLCALPKRLRQRLHGVGVKDMPGILSVRHAGRFRVLASFWRRSGAHVQEYAPLLRRSRARAREILVGLASGFADASLAQERAARSPNPPVRLGQGLGLEHVPSGVGELRRRVSVHGEVTPAGRGAKADLGTGLTR